MRILFDWGNLFHELANLLTMSKKKIHDRNIFKLFLQILLVNID